MNDRPVFCFLDETGTILGNSSRHFAVGAIVHPWPDELIEELHGCFETLVSACKRERTAQEFHFSDVTLGTVDHFIRCIDRLEKDTAWRFFSVVLDLEDPKFQKPTDPKQAWACYLRWIKHMLLRNLKPGEKATLLADFQHRPKGAAHKLATLPAIVPQLWDVLQVESHGVLMIQMADVLLGGSLYKGISAPKNQIADRVKKLRAVVGKARFNEWRVRWP